MDITDQSVNTEYNGQVATSAQQPSHFKFSGRLFSFWARGGQSQKPHVKLVINS